jgi:glycosyltransferase involved in cell wall biosynthesis
VISNFYPPAHVGGYEQECAGIVNYLRREHSVLVLTSRREARRVPREEHILRVLPYGSYRRRDSLRAPLWAHGAARTMRRLLDEFDPDLIYVWNSARIPQAALRVAELSGRPLAYRVCEHWYGRRFRDDTFLRHLYPGETGLRWVWGRGMRVVNALPALRLDVTTPTRGAVSWVSDALREMVPDNPLADPVFERTIYYGIDQPGAPGREPPEEPTFAYVGRLTRAKGVDVAIEALGILEREHGIIARLRLHGPVDNPRYARSLSAISARAGVDDRVELYGQLPREEVWRALRHVHAVVIPSRWQEPAALVAVESAAHEIPVVATRSGGIPELLREGEQAFFFDIDDVEGCAAALREVLRNPEEATRRARNARERASEFTHERYHENTTAFVEDTIAAYEAGQPGRVASA